MDLMSTSRVADQIKVGRGGGEKLSLGRSVLLVSLKCTRKQNKG